MEKPLLLPIVYTGLLPLQLLLQQQLLLLSPLLHHKLHRNLPGLSLLLQLWLLLLLLLLS
jgi:hypothetical protein